MDNRASKVQAQPSPSNAGTSLFGVLKSIAFKLPLPWAFDVFREALLLFGIGALALPAWDQLE